MVFRTRFKAAAIAVCLLIILVGGCGPFAKQDQAKQKQTQNPTEIIQEGNSDIDNGSFDPVIEEPMPSVPHPSPSEEERIHNVKLSAIGDVLIHSSVYKDAKVEDGYNFVPMFTEIRKYIEDVDLSIANQESMIGGVEIGLSDYPQFNSPFEVGDALKEIGIDVVTMANNHTLDRGEKAILNAINHWRSLDMVYTGAYESVEDQQQLRMIEKNGITMSFLAYTYGTNGIRVPEGKPYLVNLIDHDVVVQEIAKAREQSDVVIVNVHFGQEYVLMPNDSQKEFARIAAEAGADIIIGHHPHVLQPMEWIETSEGKKVFVVYSLGNFIAAQEGKYKRTGGIVHLEIEKKVKGQHEEITLKNPAFIPTWISMANWRNYRVVPLWDAPEQQLPNKTAHLQEIKQHMSQWMPELVFPDAE